VIDRNKLTSLHRKQRTIANTARVSGTGYWSGKAVCVEFCPAPSGHGIQFVRTDLDPAVKIPALVRYRIEVPRRTTLVVDGQTVEMVEHVLAAIHGLQIDNLEVRVNTAEMPGCDGSSSDFVDALQMAGIVDQESEVSLLIVTEPVKVGDDQSWVEARPSKNGTFSFKYRLDFGSDNCIGPETFAATVTPDLFIKELASARTFLLEEEARWLRQQGLGKHVTFKDLLIFGEEGPLENELRFENECVRHKGLDLVGDLALAGCGIVGHFVAHRSGHRLNSSLVRALLAEFSVQESLQRSA